jgi:hypothetical protein
MDLGALIDLGILITGIAAFIAFGWGKGRMRGRGKRLRHMLLLAWTAAAIGALMGADMPTAVFIATMMDFTIAGVALAITIHDPCRVDARTVGGISMALMPAHWVVSMAGGVSDFGWALYAGGCNAFFVIQCLIVRGWLDGVGRSIGRFVGRFLPVSVFHTGAR